ncbi:MAG TPA: hypothetical protein VMD09_15075 [Solirubrobacteraceae bacterium]|nr:hypothetical protein [Solirubrobacteraceae bacterium]
MMRIRIGLVLVVCLLIAAMAAPVAGAAAPSAVPQAGDWEGSGPDGLPLSFELTHRGGHIVATALAAGYPGGCPAVGRNAEAVPLTNPLYAGPGGNAGTGVFSSSPGAVLAGQIRGSKQQVYLSGSFSTPRSGVFSIKISKPAGCGWPDTTITWRVHRASRRPVADGTWTGPLTATGLINGNVRLVIGAQGRVIESLTTFFTCVTDTAQGNTTFRAVPASEFVGPGGAFASPLNGGNIHGHPTRWTGSFRAGGRLAGSVSIFDDCTNQLIKARFTGRRT